MTQIYFTVLNLCSLMTSWIKTQSMFTDNNIKVLVTSLFPN